MLALIPLFPFLGFVVNSTLGKRLSKNVSGGLAIVRHAGVVRRLGHGVRLAGMEPAQRVVGRPSTPGSPRAISRWTWRSASIRCRR